MAIGSSDNVISHDDDIQLEILFLGTSLNAADAMVSALRNAGIAVRPSTADNLDDLASELDEPTLDMALIDCDQTGFDYRTAVAALRQTAPETLVILLSDNPHSMIGFAGEYGARDVIFKKDSDHLVFALKREYADLVARRNLAHVRHRLNEAEQRCNALIHSSQDAIAYVHDGMHVRANPVYLEAFGFEDATELEGLPLMDLIAKEERPRFKKLLRKFDKRKQEQIFEVTCLNQGGENFDATMECSLASIDGEPCTQIVIRQHADHQALEETIEQLVIRDMPTGVYNRQYFVDQLHQQLAAPRSLPFSIAKIALSNYNEIRQSCGVDCSDAILKEVADVLSRLIPEKANLARGGERELVFMLGEEKDPEKLGRKILDALNKHRYHIDDDTPAPLFSIGLVSAEPDRQASAVDLLNIAYRAAADGEKREQKPVKEPSKSIEPTPSGKDKDSEPAGIQFEPLSELDEVEELPALQPAPEPDAPATEAPPPAPKKPAVDPAMVALIDAGLNDGKLRLLYQPVVSLQGDSRENYSVMARLLNELGEDLETAAFQQAAIDSGRMVEIDRWVVAHAIDEMVKQRRDGRRINFFVEISIAAIQDDSFLLYVCDLLRERKAKGAWLTFQFNLPEIKSNLPPARRLIEGLKKIKCRIAFTHYRGDKGTETLLKHLPIDVVKLSPEYTADLAGNEKNQDELADINQLVQRIGAKTVATGVADANSLTVLWNSGVNYVQGDFLQEPSSAIAYDFEA